MNLERISLEQLLIENDDLKNYHLYVWGTGNTTMLYQEGLLRLEAEEIYINGYIDNNKQKWGAQSMEKEFIVQMR